MKKNGILILVIFFVILLVMVIVGSLFKAKDNMYVIEQDGYIMNNTEVVEVKNGTQARITSNNTVYVGGNTYEGNTFYTTANKDEFVVLNDAYIAMDDGNVKPIEQNTKIQIIDGGYEYSTPTESVDFESGVVYNSDDSTYLVLGENNEVLENELSDQFVLTLSEGGASTFLNIDDMSVENYMMGEELISVAGGNIDPKQKTYTNNSSVVDLSDIPPVADESTTNEETKDEEIIKKDIETTDTQGSESTSESSGNVVPPQSEEIIISDNSTASNTNPVYGTSNINGLAKFFYDLFTFKPDYVPEMVLSVQPTYTTVTFDISVEDVGQTFESLTLQLTNKKTNEVTYHPISVVDGGATLKITNLIPGTEYKYDFIITYVNGEGESASNLAKSGVFSTMYYEIFIEVYEILDQKITLKVNVPEELSYSAANIVLYDDENDIVETKAINFEEIEEYGFTYVSFTGLDSNKTYNVTIEDVVLQDETPVNLFTEMEILTAKQVPVMNEPIVTVDYINSCFNIKATHISDPDISIEYVTFYAYNFDNTQKPIAEATIPYNSANATHKFCIDTDTVFTRNKNYKFSVELSGNNNYDDFKLKSVVSDSYMIDGIAPPSASIQVTDTTNSSIAGTVTLIDDEGAITTNATLQIKDTTSDIVVGSMLINEGLTEFYFDGLEAGTSYTLQVITSFDLENDNPPYNNYPITSISTYTNNLLSALAFWKE